MTWFKSLPWYFQIGAIVIILALVVLVWEKGGTAYAHYKWGKSDQQVTETLNKSNDLEKQSAELKAQADQFEKLAAAKNAQIDALTEQSKKYGAQAAASVDAINQSYAQLEKDKQIIQNSTDGELRYRICKDRHDLGFANIGQCKDWKE